MRTLIVLWTAVAVCFICSVSPAPAAEMRGLWVDAFHPGFKSAAETTEMVARAKACGFNALFVQVRKRGDAYYTSAIEERAADVTAGYDPLADVITKAHAVGMEVHAWLSVFEVYHDTMFNSADANHLYRKHPEWLMKDDRGRVKFPGDKIFLDPGVPAVRQYLVSVISEITTSYDVDGIHMDVVRYPSEYGGYNDASVARFNTEASKSGQPAVNEADWCNWRRTQVTQFVQAVYHAVTTAKPAVKVSASVFANKADATGRCFQNWEGWLSAGILDFAVPMLFPKDNRVFQACLPDLSASAHGRQIYIGQGGWKVADDSSIAQVAMARQAGFNGIVVYSYYYCCRAKAGQTTSLMDQLKAGPFATADTTPTMAWKNQ